MGKQIHFSSIRKIKRKSNRRSPDC
jgi:hypothetical protein